MFISRIGFYLRVWLNIKKQWLENGLSNHIFLDMLQNFFILRVLFFRVRPRDVLEGLLSCH